MRSRGKASCAVPVLRMVFLDPRKKLELRIHESGLACLVDCLSRYYMSTANDQLVGL